MLARLAASGAAAPMNPSCDARLSIVRRLTFVVITLVMFLGSFLHQIFGGAEYQQAGGGEAVQLGVARGVRRQVLAGKRSGDQRAAGGRELVRGEMEVEPGDEGR